MSTSCPTAETTGSGQFAIKVRVPGWATRGFFVTINGEEHAATAAPGSYLTLTRRWRANDTIELRMPFDFHLDHVVDQPARQRFGGVWDPEHLHECVVGEQHRIVFIQHRNAVRIDRGDEPVELLRIAQRSFTITLGDAYFRANEMNKALALHRIQPVIDHTVPIPPKHGGWGSPQAGLEFRHDGELRTAAILQGFVRNEGDAWEYTLDVLGRYFERVASNLRDGELREAPELPDSLLELSRLELSEEVGDVIGTYVNSAELLGQRTAELHRALASDRDDSGEAIR